MGTLLFKGYYCSLEKTVTKERLQNANKYLDIMARHYGYDVFYKGLILFEINIFEKRVIFKEDWLMERDFAVGVYNDILRVTTNYKEVKWNKIRKRLEIV